MPVMRPKSRVYVVSISMTEPGADVTIRVSQRRAGEGGRDAVDVGDRFGLAVSLVFGCGDVA
jgi:hypothetical protein